MSSPSYRWPTSTLRTPWYERLFGRPADNLPMEGQLVESRATESGWLQVTRDVIPGGRIRYMSVIRELRLAFRRLEPLRIVSVSAVLLLVAASSCSDDSTAPDKRSRKTTAARTPEARTPDTRSPACRSFDTGDVKSLEFGGDPSLQEQVLAWWPLIGPFVHAHGSVVVAGVGERPVQVRNEKGRLLGAFTLFLGSRNTNWAVGLEVFDDDREPCRWTVASLSPRIDPSYQGDLGTDPTTAYDLEVEVMTVGGGTADILEVRGTAPGVPASVGDASRVSFEPQSGGASHKTFAALLTLLRSRAPFTDEKLRSVKGLDLDPDASVAVRKVRR